MYIKKTKQGIELFKDGKKISSSEMKKGGAFSEKISKLFHEGYPQKQAVAIAYSMKDRGELQDGGSYPFFLNYGGMPGFYAQQGVEVQTPSNLKIIGKAADVTKAEQNIKPQYNLEGLPSLTERNAWNNYLDWVESKGYKPGSDSLLGLNKGTNRFEELSAEYNKQAQDKLKSEYGRVSKMPGFSKDITQEQYVKSRTVTPEMMANAQKFYGQQTSKDQWFGSETARTFYPKIQGLGVAYEDVAHPDVQKKIESAKGKFAPIQIVDYKTNQPVPYKGVVPITGYSAQGSPQYDWTKAQPFQQNMANKVYYDPAALTSGGKSLYEPYLPQRKKGGESGKALFEDMVKTYFKTSEDKKQPLQGQNTDIIVRDKKDYFMQHLKSNVAKHMLMGGPESFVDYKKCGGDCGCDDCKAQDGMQVNLFDPNDPTKTPPPMPNLYAGPFGNYTNTVPSYVSQQANSQPVFYTDPNQAGTPSNLNLTPGGDMNKIAFQKAMDAYNQKVNRSKTASNVADASMVGMNLFSNASEYLQNKAYQKKLMGQMSAENIFSDVKGSRGDYDINSGMFKPNQMTPATYKKGGQYSVDEKELQRLKNLGYQIDIIE